MASTKVTLSVCGIVVLAALFLVGIRDEPTISPFHHAALHLRAGMTADEVHALARIPRPGLGVTASYNYGSRWVIYSDRQCGESLSLVFVDDDVRRSRLTEWKIWRHR